MAQIHKRVSSEQTKNVFVVNTITNNWINKRQWRNSDLTVADSLTC